jgi:DNA polymerase-3 subunit alpha
MQLEDLEGHVEVLVFPKTYAACEGRLTSDRATLVTGRVEIEEDRVRLIAEEVCPLEELLERRAEAVEVRIEAGSIDEALVERLKGAISANRGDAQLYFRIERPGEYRVVMQAGSSCRVTPSRRLTREVEAVVGPDRVRYRPRERRDSGPQVRTYSSR